MQSIWSNEQVCQDLVTRGWAIIDDYFEPALIEALRQNCTAQQQQGHMQAAGVGRGVMSGLHADLRRDHTVWLEAATDPAVDDYLAQMEALRLVLNRQLYLGLQRSEHHFAFYPVGAFYRRHLDCFQGSSARVISTILYLNPDWKISDGGQLRLYHKGQPGNRHGKDCAEPSGAQSGVQSVEQNIDIAPRSNRFVLFLSADIPHEVLPTTVPRLSLTGWFSRAES